MQNELPPSKPLTPAQNVAMTVKLLLGAGALVGGIWALDRLLVP